MAIEQFPETPSAPTGNPIEPLGRLATYGADYSDIPTLPEPDDSGLRADMIEKHYFAKPQKEPKQPKEEPGEQEQQENIRGPYGPKRVKPVPFTEKEREEFERQGIKYDKDGKRI